MAQRVSRAFFAQHKKSNLALSKAADLAVDTSDIGVQSRTAPFIISTAAVDRDGDTLALNGWDLVDYKANPIVLFDHDPSKPIGKSEQIWTADNALRALAWFPSKDVSDLSDSVYKLIEAGVLRTASVTFLPLEFSQALDRASSSPWGQPPMNFTRQKLLEWSVVSVPSNQEALVQAKSLKVDWKAYNDVIEHALDSDEPLSAPRKIYEETHAVVKSFLAACKKPTAQPPATGKEEKSMPVQKAGSVLNKDNFNRLQAAQKHMDKAFDLHKDADDLKADAKKHMSKCLEHMKAIMDSHAAGKKDDSEPDEGGDSSQESDDDTSKKVDEENEEQKTQDGEGVEDNITPPAVGSGNVQGTVNPNLPDGEDYYAEFNKKSASIVARAKAALRGDKPKPKQEKSVIEQDYTEDEMRQAMQIAVERMHQKHLRALRGQD